MVRGVMSRISLETLGLLVVSIVTGLYHHVALTGGLMAETFTRGMSQKSRLQDRLPDIHNGLANAPHFDPFQGRGESLLA